MRVVVTRPAHSAERTAVRLKELGHQPVLLPLTRPVHQVASIADALTRSQGAIAVTSAEAIRVIQRLAPTVSSHLSRPLFAVGKATAEEARNAGFADVCHSEASGAELAELISAHRSVLSNAPLLYMAGSPRAPGFEARLTELGIPFHAVECYVMKDEEPEDAKLRSIFLGDGADAVLLYSRHSAERFFALPFLQAHGNSLTGTRFFCLSAAIADAVPDLLRENTKIAANPDEDSLLELLRRR
ncbi:uroporphyrinogen-III synthase [Rhizobium sp. BK376]|jgi:uroporphyrinogen-III synthase|uniref:uroporphyrinogen-III synthase n=1 Tax=Rhizobium sp. BK376 TaxID=2512149 RepID=UPI001047F647|nr:uroporphyrinogen-III synthase [Rhizobium sp. BK376]TCR89996.1 uroporphyrinogen-III synthase [Rhizobium sp. BK376]